MKFLDEYRDAEKIKALASALENSVTKPWTIMEICGGQTHAIMRYSLDQILPKQIELVHGPGCPVCVTPMAVIDLAVDLSLRPKTLLCSFGDMLRVPGAQQSLLDAKAKGAQVQIVYSPMDAIKMAKLNPQLEVIFLGVGFETTAPAVAMTAYQAKKMGLTNFSLLISHFLVPPAIGAIMSNPQVRVQGFLAAGHVCAVMGYQEYLPLAARYRIPIVVTGFEPLDILQGVLMCVRQLEAGKFEVENQYARCVQKDGNLSAQNLIQEVFEAAPTEWRGVGVIPQSGLRLKAEYSAFDAELKFSKRSAESHRDQDCIAGLIMQGLKKPYDCKHFGVACRPESPIGAPMVSSEGACSAYHRYRLAGDLAHA